MTNIFSLLPHTKVAKNVLFGGARQLQALWHLMKGFLLSVNYFPEKEGFLFYIAVFNKKTQLKLIIHNKI